MKEIIAFIIALIIFSAIVFLSYLGIDFIGSTFASTIAGDIFKILLYFFMGLPLLWVDFLFSLFMYNIIKIWLNEFD